MVSRYSWIPRANRVSRVRRVASRGFNRTRGLLRPVTAGGRRRLFIGAALRNPRLSVAGRRRLLAAYRR